MTTEIRQWWNHLPNNYTGYSKGGLATKYGFGHKQSLSDLTDDDITYIWKNENPTPKRKKTKRFSKKDLELAFYAGKRRRFDTGVDMNPDFDKWYKDYNKKEK